MTENGADAQSEGHTPASYMALTFPQQPEPLYTVFQEYAIGSPACPHSNFLNGVLWSPDGSCLLTASDDNWLRIFDLPQDALETPALGRTAVDGPLGPSSQTDLSQVFVAQEVAERLQGSTDEAVLGALGSSNLQPSDSLSAALRMQEGETVYGMAWYPGMTAEDPASCCFATTSRAHPIHLWDACSGGLRCSYRGYNDVDEVTAAFSVCFSPDGQHLLGGYNKSFAVFDVSRPGREYRKVTTFTKKRQENLPGMISCMAFSPGSGEMLAAGSYSGSIALYDTRTWEMLYVLSGHKGGLTQVQFTADGNFLLSGARQDSSLICWDLRGGEASGELYRMQRGTAKTNQRIQFDVEPCGRHVATGGCNGCVKVFDLQTGDSVDEIRASLDTVNGCMFHPYLNLLSVATGQRRYPISVQDDLMSSEDEGAGGGARTLQREAGFLPVELQGGMENVLRVYRLKYEMMPCPQG
ncbi:hypothetical protein CEUSTIGMA_g4842.t1 [Chlamydomonas eustigma]|uniref:Anaphase-promoting complex subunit 4 WD40 domain-containing protein n=1 Tax=Chlamydomonas eustigma TaxID=1157962 RepID=A0A250X2W7_9CHLO|nr:hypothetical protein CEUSTIGMA_g4842.t1 [Chlamydomonas eustigma]|eukprot:GAX77396.1 hypothetical protein CEUSTIGMA_g4842.t1 [Chlamydomonas eustigma]